MGQFERKNKNGDKFKIEFLNSSDMIISLGASIVATICIIAMISGDLPVNLMTTGIASLSSVAAALCGRNIAKRRRH